MPICQNCKTQFGCSCQHRTADNGTPCCSACVAAYNKAHPAIKPAVTPNNIISLDNTNPSNVTVIYRGPGRQV